MLQKTKRTFSLLEILIALAVFMIGMASLLTLFGVATATHQKAVMETKCALLVSNIIEELQNDFTKVKKAKSLPFGPSKTYPDLEYALNINPTGNDKNIYWVFIQIRWKNGGKWFGETFTTLIRPTVY